MYLFVLIWAISWLHEAYLARVNIRYVNLCLICIYVPEKTLAAFTGHGVEVEASGFVPTHATDPWHVPIELIWGQSGRAHNRGLHH